LSENVRDSSVERAVAAMHSFMAPWGIAGGWALSLFAGRILRQHRDVDVAILRAHQDRLRIDLKPASVEQVVAGVVRPWPSAEWLQPPIHEVYLAWDDGTRLEVLLNDADLATNTWLYRRDTRVRRALDRSFLRAGTVPILSPEIVLLYKSKAPRPHDESDFAAVLPLLDSDRREWLRMAIETTAPEHPWADTIAREA
jgi:hypothetical protein